MRLPAQRMVRRRKDTPIIYPSGHTTIYSILVHTHAYETYPHVYTPSVGKGTWHFDWLYKGIVWRFIRDELSPSVMLFFTHLGSGEVIAREAA